MKAVTIFVSAALPLCCSAFACTSATWGTKGKSSLPKKHQSSFILNAADEQQEEDVSSFSMEQLDQYEDTWQPWLEQYGQLLEISPKLSMRPPLPDERGKGGVTAKDSISALEVLLRVPRKLIVADNDIRVTPAADAATQAKKFSWATDLTAAALYALHGESSADEISMAKRAWIGNWVEGGWGTVGADLGPPDVRWGSKDVTGTLLATGSDNDHNIYAKFRMPCHPVLLRAEKGLAILTGADEQDAREALLCRGKNYRSMRDALLTLVETPLKDRKGSVRERRAWDVSDMLSRILSRATTLQLDDDDDGDDDGQVPNSNCVVPVHERLAHSLKENTKLVACDDEILMVATRDIPIGEQLTRDYSSAPQLDDDTSGGALRLLLQFGLPPSAW
jgi:hypothetical protein